MQYVIYYTVNNIALFLTKYDFHVIFYLGSYSDNLSNPINVIYLFFFGGGEGRCYVDTMYMG